MPTRKVGILPLLLILSGLRENLTIVDKWVKLKVCLAMTHIAPVKDHHHSGAQVLKRVKEEKIFKYIFD